MGPRSTTGSGRVGRRGSTRPRRSWASRWMLTKSCSSFVTSLAARALTLNPPPPLHSVPNHAVCHSRVLPQSLGNDPWCRAPDRDPRGSEHALNRGRGLPEPRGQSLGGPPELIGIVVSQSQDLDSLCLRQAVRSTATAGRCSRCVVCPRVRGAGRRSSARRRRHRLCSFPLSLRVAQPSPDSSDRLPLRELREERSALGEDARR
jgi:hypothetical protein